MTDEQIKKSIETQKLQLSFWEKVTHFSIVFYLLFIFVISVYFSVETIISDKSDDVLNGEIILLVISLILSFLFYKIQLSRLKFKKISTTISRKEVIADIKKVCVELAWTIEKANNKCIIAKTHPSFLSGSWGEQVTILFYDKTILINSICDPEKRSSVISMGRNKENVSRLMIEIRNTEQKTAL